MTDIQPGTLQAVEVRVARLPGPKLAPDDFTRRLLALRTSIGIDARLHESETGVESEEGLEGAEDELMTDLVAILEARFQI